MSFFAYIALCDPQPGDAEALATVLGHHGLTFQPVHLGRDYGVRPLYGRDIAPERLYEVELDGRTQDLEWLLLEPETEDARLRHYQTCGQTMGRSVRDFHDDPEVDRCYTETPLALRVSRLLRDLGNAVRTRPILINLDPGFQMKEGHGQELRGLAAIGSELWRRVAFSDLETPLRLILETGPSGGDT